MPKLLLLVLVAGLVCSCPGQPAQTAGRNVQTHSSSTALNEFSSQRSLASLLHGLNAASAFNLAGPVTRLRMMSSTRAGLSAQRHSPILAATATAAKPVPTSINSDTDDSDAAADAVTPGQAEKERFQCDPWVEAWEDTSWDDSGLVNLQTAAAIVAKYTPGPFEVPDAKLTEFWGKHAARLGYFISNALAGSGAFAMFGRNKDILDGINGDSIAFAVKGGTGLVLEAIKTYEQDWQRIKEGKYKMPWDMEAGHRQTTLPYALRQSARFVEEAIGTLERRSRRAPEDRKIWLESQGSIYPEYYKTNFHYQTDGWMSAKSAAVYETSTETLFLGRQDAMQRTSLLPLQGLKGVDGRPARILEVACGTGRFATFIRDNHPTAELTCVDLSPFYLEAARENDEYWRNFRSRDGSGESYAPAKFVQAAAEALPFDAESFDAVVCVYLFHEMPEGPRAAAAAEMSRVLRPGGTLVLTDSVQSGDRPMLSNNVDEFARLNEPHVANYFKTHLADLFVPHGLECGHKYVTSVSKTLSFTKPREPSDKRVGMPNREIDFEFTKPRESSQERSTVGSDASGAA